MAGPEFTPEGPEALDELVARANRGNRKAIQRICTLAAAAMKTGAPLPPALWAYVTGTLARIGHGEPFARAFAPLGRQSPEVTEARRAMTDLALVYWVDHARDELNLSTSQGGDPGPAFERVADMTGLSAARVRDRYYQIRDSRKTRKKH